MVDIIPIANECRESIVAEMARLDDFIQMAETLEREARAPDIPGNGAVAEPPVEPGDDSASTAPGNAAATSDAAAGASEPPPVESTDHPAPAVEAETTTAPSAQAAGDAVSAARAVSAEAPETPRVRSAAVTAAAAEAGTTKAPSAQGTRDVVSPAKAVNSEKLETPQGRRSGGSAPEAGAATPEQPELVLERRIDDSAHTATGAEAAARMAAESNHEPQGIRGTLGSYIGAIRSRIGHQLAKPTRTRAGASASGGSASGSHPAGNAGQARPDDASMEMEKVISIARKPLAPAPARSRTSPVASGTDVLQPSREGAKSVDRVAGSSDEPRERERSETRTSVLQLGQRVRQRRWMLGMTQRELGRRIGVEIQQIRNYESGAAEIDASRLLNIAAALEVSVKYFFEGLDGSGQEPVVASAQSPTGMEAQLRVDDFSEDTIIFSTPRSA